MSNLKGHHKQIKWMRSFHTKNASLKKLIKEFTYYKFEIALGKNKNREIVYFFTQFTEQLTHEFYC